MNVFGLATPLEIRARDLPRAANASAQSGDLALSLVNSGSRERSQLRRIFASGTMRRLAFQ